MDERIPHELRNLVNSALEQVEAQLQSELELKHGVKFSRKLEHLTFKRNNRVDNYLHNTSRRVIGQCIHHNIKTLIIGKNDGWKNGIGIGKKNNQQFVNVPNSKLVEQLVYKGALVGIEVITTEESYTSKASFLDGDDLPKYGEVKNPKFSGRRIKRGLYKAKNGLINADCNGAYNIVRKVKPNAFRGYDLKGLPFNPLVLNPLRTHDFLQIV